MQIDSIQFDRTKSHAQIMPAAGLASGGEVSSIVTAKADPLDGHK